MAEYPDPEKINAIIDAKSDAIEQIDQSVIHEAVGVAMALDQLRESLNLVESHMDNREFEQASHVGYNEVAHNFVFLLSVCAYRY